MTSRREPVPHAAAYQHGHTEVTAVQAPVVLTLNSAIHWINDYPLDNSIGFASVYPLDSDYRAPVAQLIEHRVVTREVVSSTPAGPTLRVLK